MGQSAALTAMWSGVSPDAMQVSVGEPAWRSRRDMTMLPLRAAMWSGVSRERETADEEALWARRSVVSSSLLAFAA
jgi:hypothetical protein